MPGIILIGLGAYFLLQMFQIPYANELLTWPTILFIIGISLLFQSKYDGLMSFPAAILIGFAIHFHGLNWLSFWPSHIGMYLLIISMSFLFLYTRTKHQGLIPGIALFLLALYMLSPWKPYLQNPAFLPFGDYFWPLVLILIGIVLLYQKKK
ncbi:LiaF transmembrane domain-containing protein [Alkalicoccobacillus murimartini]|uniref:Membrane-bound ClpP family serine protease n=1 Tax=Alkalicoccobacillus murimartini TaxID=171685 RepID=A0ABT9YJL4_9BACI|nr:DUF5668 domain-containing protein [Alkalicoccobacillus murimartini]MDQ0208022.1 membrane-bound ClpP family serine protease [Alkalicoccobacillus murimartini]